MAKTMKETTNRAKACKCVRFDDKKGFRTKFNKTNFPNELRRDVFYYAVKCYEQKMRGFSPTSVATKKKFEKFRRVSEGLKLKPLPEGFQSFSHTKKQETVQKLVDELEDWVAAAMGLGPGQGADIQADYSDNMQVGAGSARQFDMTVREDVDIQVNNPGQIQVDGVRAAAPNPDLGNTFSNDASLQNVAWNQRDNSQGRPPSRPRVPLEDLVLIFRDLMHRASGFPGRLPKFEWSEEALRSFVNHLELLEGAFEDDSNTHLRSREEELFAPLADYQHAIDGELGNEIWSNLLTSSGRPEAPGTSPNLYSG